MTIRLRLTAIVPILGASSAVQAQHLGGGASGEVSLVRVFLALFVCLVFAVPAILLIRHRYGTGSPALFSRIRPGEARIQLVESRRVGPQSDLCLVQCDGLEYLLLITPGGPLLVKDGQAPASEGR